nr:ribonuclease H-like domain-containing protein [Tanacetum cinerariifolium]
MFVLSPDFKLADESHVLLKVPRKNNMYSVYMKNIVLKESLTYLVAKATLDESMLWHRRLVKLRLVQTSSKDVRKNFGSPLIEDWISDSEDEVESKTKIEMKTVKPSFAKIEPRVVNTIRPSSPVVNDVRANQINVVKASACWVWRPTKLNSASITLKKHNYVDARGTCPISLTSRNLMEDMLPLGEEPKEEKLLVKELLKLWMFVLSPDFKLADESHVLLKVPRKNNMYSVYMKNIVLKESLTYLVAKATLDESMLWHRRL